AKGTMGVRRQPDRPTKKGFRCFALVSARWRCWLALQSRPMPRATPKPEAQFSGAVPYDTQPKKAVGTELGPLCLASWAANRQPALDLHIQGRLRRLPSP